MPFSWLGGRGLIEAGMQQEWPTQPPVPAEPRAADTWGFPIWSSWDAMPCLHSSPKGKVLQVTMPDTVPVHPVPSEQLLRCLGLEAPPVSLGRATLQHGDIT